MPTRFLTNRNKWRTDEMSTTILTIAGAMFGIPLVVMLFTALILGDLPDPMASVGGWTMVFGVIVGAIGAFFALNEG